MMSNKKHILNVIRHRNGEEQHNEDAHNEDAAAPSMPSMPSNELPMPSIPTYPTSQPPTEEPIVVPVGPLSGNWTMRGLIFRLEKQNEAPEDVINYTTTINIEHHSKHSQFVIVNTGVDSDEKLRPDAGKMVGLIEGSGDNMVLTLSDYDDNGTFKFSKPERHNVSGHITRFASGNYFESGFTKETNAQKPTVGHLVLEKA